MKAEKTQELSDLIRIFTDSFAPKGETFRENKREEMFEALRELERRAEIGRAAEKFFGLCSPSIEGFTDEMFLSFDSIEELLEWAAREGKAGEGNQ